MKQPSGRKTNSYRQALGHLRRTFIQVGLFSAAINILMLTGPIYMLQVYDRVLSSGSVATLQGLFGIVVVLYAFLGLYEFLRARLLSRAGYRLDTIVSSGAFDFWLRAGVVQDGSADNPLRDLDVVRGFLTSPAILGVFDLPWIPLFLGVVFFIHPWLGWLTLAGAGVVVIVALLNQALTSATTAEAMNMDASERNFIERSRRNAEAVMALGMQARIVQRWQLQHEQTLTQLQRGGDWTEGFSAFSKSFRMLLQSMLLTLGAYLAIQQEVSAGAIVATSIIAGRALAPVDQVIGQWRGIARAREAHRRLLMTLDRIPPPRRHVKLPPPKGNLVVVNLTKFVPSQGPVRPTDRLRILDQVNFTLAPGDGLGVIGNSAAGKSSLARLIVGIWTADAGEVRLDGATFDQWSPEDLGKHIGYLPQQLEMLPGTIAENISRFSPNADDSQIIEAATIAGVHEMILALPDGYSTHIGGATQPLSGGQIQRLGLARAIFGTPRLIVLDEPNSNLDSRGDAALTSAIQILRSRGCIVVVMAHRHSVIASVNKVMILNRGAVVHFGDKEEIFRIAMNSPAAAAAMPPLQGQPDAAPAQPAPPPAQQSAPQPAPQADAPRPAPPPLFPGQPRRDVR